MILFMQWEESHTSGKIYKHQNKEKAAALQPATPGLALSVEDNMVLKTPALQKESSA